MNILPLALLAVFFGIATALIKLVANGLSKEKGLCFQYLFCALFVLAYWAVFDRTMFSVRTFLAVAVLLSVLNYAGTFCQWSAYKINMARTSLFTPLKSVFAIILFWIFLGEYRQISMLSLAGVCLHVAAIWIFLSNKKGGQTSDGSTVWLLFVVCMVVLQAVTNFLMKVASGDVAKTHFLLCWYWGTFVFSALVLSVKKRQSAPPPGRKIYLLLPLCSLFVVAYLAALYWAFQLNSGTLVVSFQALVVTFVPVVIGWIFFGEAKMTKREAVGFACGLTAAGLILASH